MAKRSSSTGYTPIQLAALVILMAEARELTNPELNGLAGFTLTGTDRVGLEDGKLIECRKVGGGAYAHQLTESGWYACRDLLTAGRPAVKGPVAKASFVLLAGLQRGLAHRGLSPAEFFVQAGAGGQTAGDITAMVRTAYLGRAVKRGDWVTLADLRDDLARVPREDLDAVLIAMHQPPQVRIIPRADLGSLTPRERKAALRMGGEDNHVLSIEDS